MTLAEQAERMAERLEASQKYEADEHGIWLVNRNPDGPEAAALLRQCAEALRKEGV